MKRKYFILIMIISSFICVSSQKIITFQYDKTGRIVKENYSEKYELTNSYDVEGNLLNAALVKLDMQLDVPEVLFPYKIFPNPVKDYLTIELPDDGNSRIEILDLQGRRVAVFPNNQGVTNLSLQHLEPAVYIVNIYQQTGVITRKVVRY
ncbi:MAG: T9SS type A sorting domain-containing protein [Paludibacter sp.]|nr:T9SS type A sorting domain-containing protein [Paludibacter sp.]